MELIKHKKRKAPDKAAEKVLSAITKELGTLEKEDAQWPNDHLHAIGLCHLRVVKASHERDLEASRKELLKAAATIIRCLKGFEVKPEPEKIIEKSKARAARKPAEKVREAEGYFTCASFGQRISEKVCLGRREQKKRGCGSCKVGREIEKKIKIK
jgi:hypothetical protein